MNLVKYSAFTLFLLLFQAASAQEEPIIYDFSRYNETAVGETLRLTSTLTADPSSVEILVNGEPIDGKVNLFKISSIEEETCYSKSSFQKKFIANHSQFYFEVAGQELKNDDYGPLNGITANFEYIDEEWTVVDAGQYSEEILQALLVKAVKKKENKVTDFPDKLKIGDEWSMLTSELGMGNDPESNAKFTFVRVEKIDNQDFGIFEFSILGSGAGMNMLLLGEMRLAISGKQQLSLKGTGTAVIEEKPLMVKFSAMNFVLNVETVHQK